MFYTEVFVGNKIYSEVDGRIDGIKVSTGDYFSSKIGVIRFVPPGMFQRDDAITNISKVSAFHMSEKTITHEQYCDIAGVTQQNASVGNPVLNVSWYDALVFCNLLSIEEGFEPVFSINGKTDPSHWGIVPNGPDGSWDSVAVDWSADGYRLPTEMEWMWAAMGADEGYIGVTNAEGFSKSFAGSNGLNNIDDHAWYSGNSFLQVHPVGLKLPNELGLFDLSGNVWEWCWDWKDEFPVNVLSNYTGAVLGMYRVLRGGGWDSSRLTASVGYRRCYEPYYKFSNIGFRVVRQ